MIKENQQYFNRIFILIDASFLLISIRIAWYIRFKSSLIFQVKGWYPFDIYFKPALLMIPIYLILYALFDLYSTNRIKATKKEIANIIKANVFGILFFIMTLFIFRQIDYSRYLIFVFFIAATVITIIERLLIKLLIKKLRTKGFNEKHILILGKGEIAAKLLQRIFKNPQWGYKVVGILDDFMPLESNLYGIKIVGNLDDLEVRLSTPDIDEVFITLDFNDYSKLEQVINTCEKCGVRTQIIPAYYKYMPVKAYVEEVEGLPIINMRYVPLDNIVNKIIKRTFDILVSLVSIIIFFPIMLITAIIIKYDSPGPILFKQERVGFNKNPFNMYKFRSMGIQKETEEKVQWTTKDDPRKTKFGTFIRKTSIDELPQIFNVLMGDMSLVGPRPERPYFVDKFKEQIPKYMVKHQVRPGITGWAQVSGWRGDTSIEKRIEFDIYYIENWSFWFDIKIMFFTVFKGFINKNAY